MNSSDRVSLRLMILAVLTLFVLGGCGGDQASPDLSITDAWARPSPIDGGNGAVYMIIENKARMDDALIGADTAIASAVELHETFIENDVMRMRPVTGQRIALPAGGKVELKPGGLHIMLLGLNEPLVPGQSLALTLRFEQSGERELAVEVRSMDGMTMPQSQ